MKTFRSLPFSFQDVLETGAAWFLALVWIAPLVYAFWAAFHPGEYAVHFDIFAPLTLENFREALSQAPFLRYAFNTFILVNFRPLGTEQDCPHRAIGDAQPTSNTRIIYLHSNHQTG